MMSTDRRIRMDAALGKIPCDLTVKNVRYVNVFTGEIYDGEVDVKNGYVVRVRRPEQPPELPSGQVFDGEGNYLIPGFIDSHMHVESTMMTPENFSRAAIPWGTTTICTDPHEIANVMGIGGVKFMLENGKRSALRQYVLAPSCVPAVPGLEDAGAEFGPDEIGQLLDMDGVIGIAELMDYVGICRGTRRMEEILEKGREKKTFLQGHSPLLSGNELTAYVLAGVQSDHESEETEEILEKLRRGMYVDLRASSLVNHMKQLAEGLKSIPFHDRVSICTDDVHVGDLADLGHVNKVVRYAIAEGLDPVDVIRMATINAAREYGFADLGAVAPGYRADMQLVKALDGSRPEYVFMDGRMVAEKGRYTGDDREEQQTFENTVRVEWITGADAFSLQAGPENRTEAVVNVLVPLDSGNVLRKTEPQILPVTGGRVAIDGREDLAYVCVCNRHGKMQKTVAVIQGFGLKEGAVGTTVSHDSHNVVIVYRKEEDALAVLRKLEETGGGLCAVKDGQVLAAVALPVAGLMSDRGCHQVAEELDTYEKAFYRLCDSRTPLMSCSIMSLTALPGIVVTDRGLVDGDRQIFVPVLAEK